MTDFGRIPPLTDRDASNAIMGILIKMAVGIMFWLIVLSVFALNYYQ